LTRAKRRMNESDAVMNSSSSTGPESNCNPRANIIATQVVIPFCYFLIFVGGLVLNMGAAWTFYYVSNRSSFVIYLKCIVLADLLETITLPFKILADSKLGPWHLKAFVCRYSAVLFYISMYTGLIFLGLISFDRFLKIMKPTKTYLPQKVRFAKALSVIVWLLMFLLALPNSILTNQPITKDNAARCMQLKSPLGKEWHKQVIHICMTIFWINLVLHIVFYASISRRIYLSYKTFQQDPSKVKKVANRNIFSILVVFILCFVPYHFCRLYFDKTREHSDCRLRTTWHYLKEAATVLCAANVCLDPIIYLLLCKAFSKALLAQGRVVSTSSEGSNY
uniref:G-protein coupled receptors family 1 profile domain-containing protein n=1 Tax=Callorhinchus milii TaxID=7868 RepID=A0A4W3IAG3_CALMI